MDKGNTILCIGSCDYDDIKNTMQELTNELYKNGYNNVKLVSAGDIFSFSESVTTFKDYNAFLLCEKKHISTYVAVEQEISYLKTIDKPILGILFI